MNMAYDITLNSGVKVTVTPADIAELVELAMRDPIGRVLAVKKFHTAITLISETPLADSKFFIDKLILDYKEASLNLNDILIASKVLEAFQMDTEHDSSLSDPYQEFCKFIERKKKELNKNNS